MKIAAVCGSGLGSSFMVEMNISSILKKKGISSIETTHFDVGSAAPGTADYFFVGKDLADSMSRLDNVVVLDSIIDKKELEEKITKVLAENNITE
jgi:PTS system ascorbate-specific IIB component